MEFLRAKLIRELTRYFEGDDRRIEHALRVLHHADHLVTDYAGSDLDVVIASALLHDVGIKKAEELLGHCNGSAQEEYGPPIAESLLVSVGFPAEKIETVKDIIGNHHSPSRYDYPELALLKAADLIVNRDEKV